MSRKNENLSKIDVVTANVIGLVVMRYWQLEVRATFGTLMQCFLSFPFFIYILIHIPFEFFSQLIDAYIFRIERKYVLFGAKRIDDKDYEDAREIKRKIEAIGSEKEGKIQHYKYEIEKLKRDLKTPLPSERGGSQCSK